MTGSHGRTKRRVSATCRGWASRGRRLWLAVLVVAASCAPATEPARTVLVDGAPVPARAGETVRALSRLGYGSFGLQPGDLDPLPLPEIVVAPREDVTWAFVQRGVQAPDGWRARLDRVVRIVEPLDEGGRALSLEVALRIAIPAEARPGLYYAAVLVRAPGFGQHWVDVTVEIEVPEPTSATRARPA